MTWSALLLTDPSACLRWRVLREIYRLPLEHPEVADLAAQREHDPLAAQLFASQQADGSWRADALGLAWGAGSEIQATALALNRLALLGFAAGHPAVCQGAEFLFSKQAQDGSWPLGKGSLDRKNDDEGYAMIPLQTSLPLRGLAACGFAVDPRAGRAYDWLLTQRLPEGAWPTGIALSGVFGYVAGYRRLAHSRWGCRSNTTGALACLALHPQLRRSPEAARALDLLLGRETRERDAVGYDIARLLGAQPPRGFITYYARFDTAFLLSLCAQIGASIEDERVRDLVDYLRSLQGPYGLWEYPARPQLARWLTFDLLSSLQLVDANEGWITTEPRTPFQPYPRPSRRF